MTETDRFWVGFLLANALTLLLWAAGMAILLAVSAP